MAPYQDPMLAVDDRVSDLLQRMTLEEKAGMLFHDMICPGPDGGLAGPVPGWNIDDTRSLLQDKRMSHFNVVGHIDDPRLVAEWHNTLQRHVLEHTRLGIPVTLSTDPRSHFTSNIGTSFKAGVLSQWPETFGFGALRDPELAQRFGDCVRQEYLAIGLRVALHPQADLATEYRWSRSGSTFGEDAGLAARLVASFIRGMQGPLDGNGGDGRDSVSTMTKHFPGAGPEKDGLDPHFAYGREQVYPGDNFDYHLEPFQEAIKAGTRQMMPGYALPVGTKYEEVGFAFNKGIITDLLRSKLKFDGIICTDWGLITDAVVLGQDLPARAWGCEDLGAIERVVKILNAGCDQFGGETRPELVVEAVSSGLVPEGRIDDSVRRLLREKFILGLFDDRRFIDVEKAVSTVGNPAFVEMGLDAQRRAITILVNHNNILPIKKETLHGSKVYVEGLRDDSASKRDFEAVASPADADIALLRLQAPHEPQPGGFEALFHSGSLEFPPAEVTRVCEIIDKVPIVVVDVHLDRPAVLTPLVEKMTQVSDLFSKGESPRNDGGMALMVNYGAVDEAFLDVCFGTGTALAQGKLPFDLPRSMDAVCQSREDKPFDTKDALFKFGFGLEYQS